MTTTYSQHAKHWALDPEVHFLNHGSFGACPRAVLDFQHDLRARMERQPVRFLARELEGMLDEARAAMGAFLGADPDDLALVPNATAGVNTILRSLRFDPGDELLVTDHEYNACANALRFAARRDGAEVVVVSIPLPVRSQDDVVDAILSRVTARTRLALVDHVTSQTALVFPVERIIRELEALGVDTLVDGAHAPGMLDLDIGALAPAYYTGNCHKWVCAPKGAAFLWVRRDRQQGIRPLSISHGANSPRTDRGRFRVEFDWTGTLDPTAALSIPEAIRVMGAMLPAGWDALRAHNRGLALRARRILLDAVPGEPLCPESMLGSMAAISLPDGTAGGAAHSPLYDDPLQRALRERHNIEAPVIPWPAPPKRLLRVSAQVYNGVGQYEALARAAVGLLGAGTMA